jgi:hypothetical protein
MKVVFDHSKGIFTKTGESLLEVYAITEYEDSLTMFNGGWLPYKDRWYQTKSSRINLIDNNISKRRKKELININISCTKETSNNLKIKDLINKSILHLKFDAAIIDDYLNIPHIEFWMDDAFCGIVNMIDNIPYYTFMIWDKTNIDNSYGTLSFYAMIEYFKKEHQYLYISEYYEQFSYKSKLPGFEWWDGIKWNTKFI